jgi:hypothetical protein
MGFYVHDTPVSHGHGVFVGRELTMRSLTTGLQSNRVFAVCGGPRLGRSSVLRQLFTLNQQQWLRNPKAVKLVPVVLDVATINLNIGAPQKPPTQRPTPGQPRTLPAFVPPQAAAEPPASRAFAQALWDATVRAINDPRIYGSSPPPKVPQPAIAKSADPWGLFHETSAELWRATAGTSAWARTVYFLDNCDSLTTRILDVVLPHVNKLLATQEAYAPTAAVLTGGRLLREFVTEKNSPLRMARPLTLTMLRNSEADALVRAGMPGIDAESLELLKYVTGRHPFLIQRLLGQMEEMGGVFDIDAALQQAWPDIEPMFQHVWAELDLQRNVTYRGAYAAPEHALLQYLIDAKREIVLKDAERELGIKPLKEYAELLEYVGVVDRQIRGDFVQLRAPFDLFNRWYLNRIMQ